MPDSEKQEIVVGLLSPYLAMPLERLFPDARKHQEQILKYGASYESLAGIPLLETSRYRIILQNPYDEEGERRAIPGPTPHFIISGCSIDAEEHIRRLTSKFPHFLVGRYSTYYGKKNDYSGFEPAQAGYALDIPKRPGVVRAMLTHDGVMGSILLRNMEHLEASLDDLNSRLEMPVIITEHLRRALHAAPTGA